MNRPYKINLILLTTLFLNGQSITQSKVTSVNKLVDIEIGMTCEKVIEKYSKL
jgi:hypothetical protein